MQKEGGTPAESTMSKAINSEDQDIQIQIPASRFHQDISSQSAVFYWKDTAVNKIDSAKVFKDALSRQKQQSIKFNKENDTNFKP